MAQQKNSEKFRKFPERLRQRMEWLHLQQNELADLAHVAPATVHNWLNGQNLPKGKSLRDLFRAIKLDTEELKAWLMGADVVYPPQRRHSRDETVRDLLPVDEVRRRGHGHLDARFDECRNAMEVNDVFTTLTVSLPLRHQPDDKGQTKTTQHQMREK